MNGDRQTKEAVDAANIDGGANRAAGASSLSCLQHSTKCANAQGLVFLTALWPNGLPDDAQLGIVRKAGTGMATTWYGDVASAAAYADGQTNVWVCVGTRRPALGAGKRGGAADVTALPGLWADLDVGDEGHKPGAKLPNPPTLADALALLDAMPLPPTMAVNTGHGLHAYWLFREPWLLDSDQEHERAAALLEGWEALLRVQATAHGWNLDKTANLDRMLRVPGTVNLKADCPAVPVTIMEGPHEDRRYNPGDLEDLTPLPMDPTPTTERSTTPSAATGNQPGDLFAAATPWHEIIEPHGWTYLYTRLNDGTEVWRRPGKTEGQSATIGHHGRDRFYVFSSAAEPFAVGEHTKFGAYALLNHGGDFHAAAAALRALGFDDAPTPPDDGDAPPPEPPPWKASGATEDLAPATRVQTAQPQTPAPTIWTATALLATEFPAPVWVCPDLLPTGLGVLGGRPKLGKSWLGLQLSLAVATGGRFLEREIAQGKALYIALEDSPRRMQGRIRDLCPNADTPPEGLDVAFTWPPLNGDGLAHLEAALRDHQLVIVDTLARSMTARVDWDAIGEVTAIMAVLQSMAQAANACVLLIDHHRKPNAQSPDQVDDLLGSTGKSAVADTLWGLYRKRGEHGATLQTTGRDLEETTLALNFDGDTHCWQATDAVPSGVQGEILDALDDIGPLSVTELAAHLDKPSSNISRELGELLAKGKVRKQEGRKAPYELV